MLGGASVNKAAINAAVSVAIVSASAAWSAEAIPTFEEPRFVFYRTLDIDCVVHATFGGYREVYAKFDASAQVGSLLIPEAIYAGEVSFTHSLVFNPILTNQRMSFADIEASAAFTATPYNAFADVHVTSAAEIVIDGYKIQFSEDSEWGIAEDPTFGGGDVTRGVWGDWFQDPIFFPDAYIDEGGVINFDGYISWDAGGSLLDIPQNLVKVFITDGFFDEDSDFAPIGKHTHYNSASFGNTSVALIKPNRVTHISVDAMAAVGEFVISSSLVLVTKPWTVSASGDFLILPSVKMQGDWESTGIISTGFSAPVIKHAAKLAINSGSSEDFVGVRTSWAYLPLEANSDLDPDSTLTGDCELAPAEGIGAWFSVAGVITLLPAPSSRRYVIEGSDREFIIDGSGRTFTV